MRCASRSHSREIPTCFPPRTRPATTTPAYPRMGERFRLKQNFDISGFSAANRVILQALKTYGMIVADNGSGWYLSGAPRLAGTTTICTTWARYSATTSKPSICRLELQAWTKPRAPRRAERPSRLMA